VPHLSDSAVVIHYEEALYQVYAPLPLPLICRTWQEPRLHRNTDCFGVGSSWWTLRKSKQRYSWRNV